MPTTKTQDALDLSVDMEVFSAPKGDKQPAFEVFNPQDGGWTTTTTCWSCSPTCGDVCDASTCAC